MELQTKRLKLVPCTESLVSTISNEDFEMGPHIQFHIEELRKDPSLIGWGVWLVIEKETIRIIGDIGFKGKPNGNHAVEVGYGMIPTAQGNGYATEAVRELITWAFSHESVDEVIAECDESNLSSIRVLEKLNMKRINQEANMLKWQLIK
ncbi:ribosomal-protein-alanine N-acetyltransferase [Bacillus mesophilus]|uniref:GNAT family N-acetyltransferase n=1 Tax=Bacillus mesophilus TaxID=1808955 RepID=A0A6M0Q6G5_9BACI|nr:GNAT family N-acetyltransferase [Bacillus mesophilus]MBM7660519.1 ribosomal-protein-alanine N-acetyltransferase [Bacillus mesophilus]NEY71932.1 GNAT family N-acetyltransferase [Bacillus mesophilus]